MVDGFPADISTCSILRCTIIGLLLAVAVGCDSKTPARPATQTRELDQSSGSIQRERPAAVHASAGSSTQSLAQELRVGTSPDELYAYLLQRGPVQGVWPAPPAHQFTTLNGSHVVAVTAAIGHPSLVYYFIFVDGGLARIIDNPTSSSDVAISREESFPEQCRSAALSAERILSSTTIDIDEFERKAAQDLRQIRASARHAPPLGQSIVASNHQADVFANNPQMPLVYDPFRVRCGMPVPELETLIGPAVARIAMDDERTALIFGASHGPSSTVPWVLVLAQGDQVESVFSRWFLDAEARRIIENHLAAAAGSPTRADDPVMLAGQE